MSRSPRPSSSFRGASSGAALIIALTIATMAADAQVVRQPDQDEQYKKQNRDQITKIATGKPQAALNYAENYLSLYPEDLEAWFIKALALAALDRPNEAARAAVKSTRLGLPLERYFAGPKNLTEPILAHANFKNSSPLLHGPLIGNVTTNSARIWARTPSELEIRAILAKSPTLSPILHTVSTRSKSAADNTAILEFSGLEPNTRYFYQLKINETDGAKGSFTTSPTAETPTPFTIGFGGGAGYTPWYERMWDTILEKQPRAFLLLGDNVYIDTPEVPETQRYCYYRRQSRPEFRRFVANTPIYSIWDDHDFGDNDCVSSLSLDSPPWKLDVLNVFRENWANPGYGTPETPGVFYKFSIADVDFFMLDCRFYRQDPKKFDQPSMIGPRQKEWLLHELANSTATFKMLVSSVPWAPGVKPGSRDTWDGFPDERQEIFSFINKEKIDGVVLLAADRHRSDARRIPQPNGYPLFEFMSSRLTNIHTHKLMQNARGSEFIFGYNETCSFGALEFDTTKPDPQLRYDIYDIDGELIQRLTIRKSAVSFK